MRKDSRLQKETKLLGTVCISTEPEAKPRRGSRPLEVTSESSSRESTPRAPFRPRGTYMRLHNSCANDVIQQLQVICSMFRRRKTADSDL